MVKKIETLVRVNSRVRKDQKQYLKDEAKRRSTKENPVGEAEVHREALDFYINNHKKK